MVPEGWKFPSTVVKSTWNLWHFGHVQDRVRPLRYLKKVDLVGAAQYTLWSKCRGVMSAVAKEMVEMSVVQSVEEVEKMTVQQSSAAFDGVIAQLMEKAKAGTTRGSRRWTDMSISTLYDRLTPVREKKRKRQHAEEGEETHLSGMVELETPSTALSVSS